MFDENNDKKKYIKRRGTSFGTIFGVFLIFSSFGIYSVFASSLSDDVDTVSSEIAVVEAKINTISETIASYDLAKAEIEKAGKVALSDSLSKIPERMYQDRVILNILELASNNDVEMNSLTFGKGTFGAIGSLRINASFSGNYNDLIDFLEAVEGNDRLLKVDSVTIQMGNESILSAKRVNFSVTMEAFYQTN